MSQYLLTIRIPIAGMDNVDARISALNQMEQLGISADLCKLQRIHDDRPPEKVSIGNDES